MGEGDIEIVGGSMRRQAFPFSCGLGLTRALATAAVAAVSDPGGRAVEAGDGAWTREDGWLGM